jgi:hypothetical protein
LAGIIGVQNKARASFLKKRSKKLLKTMGIIFNALPEPSAQRERAIPWRKRNNVQKFFASFFQKRSASLSLSFTRNRHISQRGLGE